MSDFDRFLRRASTEQREAALRRQQERLTEEQEVAERVAAAMPTLREVGARAAKTLKRARVQPGRGGWTLPHAHNTHVRFERVPSLDMGFGRRAYHIKAMGWLELSKYGQFHSRGSVPLATLIPWFDTASPPLRDGWKVPHDLVLDVSSRSLMAASDYKAPYRPFAQEVAGAVQALLIAWEQRPRR